MKLAFVIARFNSSQTLPIVINEIISVVNKTGCDYQIVLVNDGSSDGTFEEIKMLCARDPKITGINLTMNFGQHSAQMAGFSFADADIIVCMDDDGQSPVGDLQKMLDKLNDGYDVVYASYSWGKRNIFRGLISWLNHKMTEMFANKPKDLITSNFYMMKRFVMEEIKKYRHAYPYIDGLIFRVTKNITNVETEYRRRISGKSAYNLGKLFSLWVNGFTAFSVKPLRIVMIIGTVIAAVGIGYGIYIVLQKIFNPDYILVGWSSLMTALLFVGGMIMISLGFIGEYVGRIYLSLNKKPQYVIKEVINSDATIKQHRGEKEHE